MKLFGKVVLFGAGAALGYYLANNKVDVEASVEPIVEKVKTKINEVIKGGSCECEDETCECCCEDAEEAAEEVKEAVDEVVDGFVG